MALWKNGVFADDAWRSATPDDDAAPMPVGGTILSLARWTAMRERPMDTRPLGVRVEPGETIDAIVPDLPRLALVALSFPKFSDGRSFSKASMLRRTHGFEGEIRAVGDVLWDQLQLMARCGFDAFEITNEPTLRALQAGKVPVMTDYYQPGEGAETRQGAPRAWARRAIA